MDFADLTPPDNAAEPVILCEILHIKDDNLARD